MQSIIITLSNIIIQSQINTLGVTSVASFTVYFRVELIVSTCQLSHLDRRLFPLLDKTTEPATGKESKRVTDFVFLEDLLLHLLPVYCLS